MKFITHKRMMDIALRVDKVNRFGWSVLVTGTWYWKSGHDMRINQSLRIKYEDLATWFMSNDLKNWNEIIL